MKGMSTTPGQFRPLKPIAVAAIAPRRYCPSAPMFHAWARNAIATASPQSMSGQLRARASANRYRSDTRCSKECDDHSHGILAGYCDQGCHRDRRDDDGKSPIAAARGSPFAGAESDHARPPSMSWPIVFRSQAGHFVSSSRPSYITSTRSAIGEQLVEIAVNEQNARAAIALFEQLREDKACGRDVEAAYRVVRDDQPGRTRQFPGEQQLLLVPAAQLLNERAFALRPHVKSLHQSAQ